MTSLRASFAAGTSIAAILALTISAPSLAATGQDKPSSISFAVIGDVPYGAAQIAAFPDGSTGSTPAGPRPRVPRRRHQERLVAVHRRVQRDDREQFDRFEMPLLYTPGDNEWTDCHRPAAGAYNPLERLARRPRGLLRTAGTQPGARPIKVD